MQNNFFIPQSPLLKDIVSTFWQSHRLNNPAVTEIIIPKGVIEVIFSFETPVLQVLLSNQTLNVPRCFVQGIHSSPIHLHLTGRQTFFGVVLHPFAAKYLFNVHPCEFSDRVIDLTLIESSFNTLWHQLGEQNDFTNRVTVFTNWLLKRVPQLTDREKAINGFLNIHTNTHFSGSGLASHLCYSSRQLARKLYDLTGMNTENILLYKKYLQSVHLIHTSHLSLTEISYDCRFSDQSHFIRTFKSFTQLMPKEYRQRKSSVIGHIYENVR